MPKFECTVCGQTFEVPQAALDKYPGWEPRHCREHSPNRKKKTAKRATAPRRESSARRDENLTLEQVLGQYTEGPETGVFTDGGSIPNPGPGGWGMVWVENGEIRSQAHGHDPDTTNNRMELTALIAAFKALPEDAQITVFTDSRLCLDTITKWAPGWERRGWKRKGEPLKNLDLVKELLALYRRHPDCRLEWIAAHNGYRWNEYADSLASAWRRAEL
jgi:ribonuclease HI